MTFFEVAFKLNRIGWTNYCNSQDSSLPVRAE